MGNEDDTINWQEHVEYLIDNRDDYDTMKKYLDNLHGEISGNKTYDKKRHHNDTQVVQDINDLVEEWFTHHLHEYDDEKMRKKWKKRLVEMIQYKRDENMYEITNGKREYMGPYIGFDYYNQDTGRMYCHILRSYYGLIGCTWQNG